MWGQVGATDTPSVISGSEATLTAYETEVGDRLPTKPISALATDCLSSRVNTSGSEAALPRVLSALAFTAAAQNTLAVTKAGRANIYSADSSSSPHIRQPNPLSPGSRSCDSGR